VQPLTWPAHIPVQVQSHACSNPHSSLGSISHCRPLHVLTRWGNINGSHPIGGVCRSVNDSGWVRVVRDGTLVQWDGYILSV